MPVNLIRLGLASVAATVVSSRFGGIAFAVLPLAQEYANHPGIFRSQDSMKERDSGRDDRNADRDGPR